MDAVTVPRRVIVDLRGIAEGPLDTARLLLIADVACRVASADGMRPGLVGVCDHAAPADTALGGRMAAAVPQRWVHDLAQAAVDPTDLLVRSSHGAATEERPAVGRVMPVAEVDGHGHAVETAARAAAGDLDPLVLRLALLHFLPEEPAELSAARLHRAAETLRRWQLKVADWHDMDPAPGRDEVVDTTRRALRDRLDTPWVLSMMHRIEFDLQEPSQSKFQLFTDVDRVLGLNLTRFVGKQRRW